MLRYILASVQTNVELDRSCPHCQRANGNIHSGVRQRRLSDLRVSAIAQRRMKCPHCGLTWTSRPDGVSPGRQRSDRLRGIGVILYMLGLSYRAVEKFLPCLECRGSKSTIERDVAEAGQKVLPHVYLASFLRGEGEICELRKVI